MTDSILKVADSCAEWQDMPPNSDDPMMIERDAMEFMEGIERRLRALAEQQEKERAFLEAAKAKVALTEPGAAYWNATVKIKRQLERQVNDRLLAAYRALEGP